MAVRPRAGEVEGAVAEVATAPSASHKPTTLHELTLVKGRARSRRRIKRDAYTLQYAKYAKYETPSAARRSIITYGSCGQGAVARGRPGAERGATLVGFIVHVDDLINLPPASRGGIRAPIKRPGFGTDAIRLQQRRRERQPALAQRVRELQQDHRSDREPTCRLYASFGRTHPGRTAGRPTASSRLEQRPTRAPTRTCSAT